jgi:hypothetical protein
LESSEVPRNFVRWSTTILSLLLKHLTGMSVLMNRGDPSLVMRNKKIPQLSSPLFPGFHPKNPVRAENNIRSNIRR